jgi:hypothetical protein
MVEALHGDEAAARLVLAELTDELHRLRKFERLTTVAHLAEAAAALGADAASAALYEAMLPYANQVVAGMTVCCLGSVDRHLGMLAGVLKRWDEAAAHFDRALAIDAALRAPPLLARTQYWYAHLLTTCPGGDQARAVELAGAARSTTAALGMATLTAQIGELFDAVRR